MPYWVLPEVPAQLKERGRATLKAFGVKSRFVHFEFFRLTKARKGLGEVGDFVGLETNMRPAGGYTPDMMNFAHSTDVAHTYAHDANAVMARYGARMAMTGRIPAAIAPDLGDQMYMAHIRSEEELQEYLRYLSE